MYCDKLIDIVQLKESSKYNISRLVIHNLDKFIKEKTTLREREKLNPYKFSIEMNISQETAMMTFVYGVKCSLFFPRFYYNCYCGEQFEVVDINEEVQCTCEKRVTPNKFRDRIYVYFRLLESPTICEWEKQKSLYPLDFMEEVGYDAENFTLADLEHLAGSTCANDLISFRNDMFERFLKEDK